MKPGIILMIIFLAFGLTQCKTSEDTIENTVYTDTLNYKSNVQMLISIENGKSFNHPTYVIWEEDMSGNYNKTIFITKSYASGIFGHQMIGDSIWLDKAGSSYQPAALPYWTFKKGPIVNNEIIPTPEHPYVDAYTGATPTGNFQFKTAAENNVPYRLLIEVNQPWDWNKYWNNNKYFDNAAYRNSAQPSLIYSAVINQEESVYYLNPIGHGDPKGESGKLFTNLSTLTSAKAIFQSVKIEIINQD